jgi:hypothetical protein
LWAGVGSALAIAATALWAGAAGSASAATAPVKLSAAPLGINIAPWDALYTGTSGGVIQMLLKKARIDQIRYGGGVSADYYNWQTNTDIGKCLPKSDAGEFTAKCATHDALPFSLFSKNTRAIGAQSFVTVNYGSGTAAEAAAWVKQAKSTAGQAVGLWEVGNESYGCWEVNNDLALPPARYAGYLPGVDSTCPMWKIGVSAGMKIMADTYAVNAGKIMAAMKAASPSAQLGVPWAFNGDVQGAAVAGDTTWNDIVLGTDKKYISFVDAHWYPFNFSGNTGGANPSDQQVMQSVFQIPWDYSMIKSTLARYVPNAKVVVGETGVTYLPTTVPCTPVGALFTAGDVLSWLAAGAQSVDWWDLNSYGNTGTTCVNPDEGMFTSSAKPAPQTPYMGYLLASALAQPGASLSELTTTDPNNVLGFQSVLPGGKVAVALINTNASSASAVTVSSALTGNLSAVTYSAGNQNASNTRTVGGTTTASAVASGIVLPAESMVVLETS